MNRNDWQSIQAIHMSIQTADLHQIGIQANKEIKRVLKSSGKMIFCEHGVSPDENIKKWQKRLNSIWGKIAGGCNIYRNIPMLIKDSGFKIEEMDEMYLPKTPKIAGYNYWGYARVQ